MTFEEMEKSLGGLVAQMKHVEDAQVVQGVLERRIEEQIESLTAVAEATNRSLEKLLQVAAGHEQRLAGVEDRLARAEDRLADADERWARTEAAMNALFEHMDRFIRGLGPDGHKQGTPEQ